ncbi:MAG: type 4 pilus major pilin [Alphaproteobacteria bacterium]|nr:type 4 pilus major pilin [Alphaproteobacteria bacterium]
MKMIKHNVLCQTVTKKGSHKGITLIELAIVLGVMGLVGASIWATASSVRSRQSIQDSVQLVSEIAANVRGVYTGFSGGAVPDLQTQIDRGFYPLSIVNEDKTDTLNAWGGTVHLTFPGSGPMNGFSIEFSLPNGLSSVARREACLGMITRMQGSSTINPATGSAWTTSGSLPSGGVPSLDLTQGSGPSLVFVNTGSWVNVTGTSAGSLFGPSGSNDCNGFAYYYRL